MKLLIPFLLLTLLAGCNSKTNTIKVESRGDSSSGGSSSGGTSGGGTSGGGSFSGGGTTVPGVTITKGCVASGYKRSTTSGEAPYITTTGVVNSKRYNQSAVLWSSANSSIKSRLYTDGVLRMRVVALSAPARNSTDQYGNICNEDPTATMNSYTKMQLLYRIKDGYGNVYTDGYFSAATVENGTSDCSDIIQINPSGSLSNSESRPFTVEIVGALSNLFCIRNNNGSSYGCSSLQHINSAITSTTKLFPCVQFTIQVETDETLVIPPKS